MASYVTSLRKGVTRYCKLAIELIFGIAVVNTRILHKETSKKKTKLRNFKNLADGLLKLRIANREQQNSRSVRMSSNHDVVERVNSNGKSIRRYCNLCYNKINKKCKHERARN